MLARIAPLNIVRVSPLRNYSFIPPADWFMLGQVLAYQTGASLIGRYLLDCLVASETGVHLTLTPHTQIL